MIVIICDSVIAVVSHYIVCTLVSRRVLSPVLFLSDLRPSGLSVCWERSVRLNRYQPTLEP